MRRSLVLPLLLAGLLAPTAAQAKTFYATPSPANGADCESKAMACSLADAFSHASNDPTDRIEVGTGDYGAAIAGQSVSLPVTGEPGKPRPVIHATGTLNFAAAVSHLDVQGSVSGTLVGIGGTSSDLDVRNTAADGTGCFVTSATLSNALCVGGSDLVSQAAGAAAQGTNPALVNVTGVGGYGVGCFNLAHCAVRNVIADGSTQDVYSEGTVTATTSAYADTAGTGTVIGAPVAGVPAYESGTFKPVSTAATIDAGSTGAGVGGTDLDGNARTLGAAPDVGAYESRRAYVTPAVTTDVTETSATLHAAISTNGLDTTWTWAVTGGAAVPGNGSATARDTPYDATLGLTGLLPGTTYAYDVVATNSAGVSKPATITFTTAGTAPQPGGGGGGGTTPVVTPTPAPTTAPAPTPTPAAPKPLKVTAGSKTAAKRLLAKGKEFKVTVRTPVAAGAKVKADVRAGKKRLGRLAVPAKALKIDAGGTGTIGIKASKALRKKVKAYLRKHRKAKLTIVLAVTVSPQTGKATKKTLRVTGLR